MFRQDLGKQILISFQRNVWFETILKYGLKNKVFVYNWHYKHENLCGIVLTKATFAYDTTTQGAFFVLA